MSHGYVLFQFVIKAYFKLVAHEQVTMIGAI